MLRSKVVHGDRVHADEEQTAIQLAENYKAEHRDREPCVRHITDPSTGTEQLAPAVNQKAPPGGETETFALNGRRRDVLGESGQPCSPPERVSFSEYWPFREHLPPRH